MHFIFLFQRCRAIFLIVSPRWYFEAFRACGTRRRTSQNRDVREKSSYSQPERSSTGAKLRRARDWHSRSDKWGVAWRMMTRDDRQGYRWPFVTAKRLCVGLSEKMSQTADAESETGSICDEERVRKLFQACDGDGDGYIDR